MTGNCFLLLLISMASVAPVVQSIGFDLNEKPEDDSFSGSTSPRIKPRLQQPAKQIKPTSPTTRRKLTRQQIEKIKELEEKKEILYKILEICDDENFDIEKIEVPENWPNQSQAMMVLTKISREGWIKKSEKTRFVRIMENCGKIRKKVEEIAELTHSPEEKRFGLNTYDIKEFRMKMEASPLEDLRNRFSNPPFVNRDISKRKTAISPPPQPPPLPPKNFKSRIPIIIGPLISANKRQKTPPVLHEFFPG